VSTTLEIYTGTMEVALSSPTAVLEISSNIPNSSTSANNITVVPYRTITATVLQEALEQLADQNFRGTTPPSGVNIEVGDTWYDTVNNVLYVYRTFNSVTDWYPLVNSDAETPDHLDGGAF
jgi:hypothetical protein